ncbi:hypothetical protein GUJ93_ZPchr0010g9346 [Zizania palustris]|uniref:Uncharacterized protein n=1 Tax=Zizania palustris TaxID=103762 RepID=A0A8J6BGU6_ZIZPA|nr:hypothetical protein GUJ93_ZPchr0010g9346 [Zizania palustris]
MLAAMCFKPYSRGCGSGEEMTEGGGSDQEMTGGGGSGRSSGGIGRSWLERRRKWQHRGEMAVGESRKWQGQHSPQRDLVRFSLVG